MHIVIINIIFQFNTNEMLPPQNTPTSPQSNNNVLFGNDAFGSTVSFIFNVCVCLNNINKYVSFLIFFL